MKICNRCGRCCYYQKGGVWLKCRNLVHHGTTTSCRIWPNNVGVQIDDGIICTKIETLPFTFVGCPYNEGKPIVFIRIGRYEGSELEPQGQEKQRERYRER